MLIHWWLCPLLLISAGTERNPLHAMAAPNSASNLEIAECVYKSNNLLNPWSLIPLELSHSTLLPHTTYKKFRVPSSCFCFPQSGVIFNACQGVIEARMSLLPSNSAWRISITNSRQSSSLAVIQEIHLVQCGRQRLKKICCNYCVIKTQWFSFISLWHKICICDSHLLCREYGFTKTSSWDLVYKVVQKV